MSPFGPMRMTIQLVHAPILLVCFEGLMVPLSVCALGVSVLYSEVNLWIQNLAL
jgi:hypothetical protein